jgi:hypothetical protein
VHLRRVGAARTGPVVVPKHPFAGKAVAITEGRGTTPNTVTGDRGAAGLDCECYVSGETSGDIDGNIGRSKGHYRALGQVRRPRCR